MFSILTSYKISNKENIPDSSLTKGQKAALIGDVALGAIAALVATLAILSVCGVNLGPLNVMHPFLTNPQWVGEVIMGSSAGIFGLIVVANAIALAAFKLGRKDESQPQTPQPSTTLPPPPLPPASTTTSKIPPPPPLPPPHWTRTPASTTPQPSTTTSEIPPPPPPHWTRTPVSTTPQPSTTTSEIPPPRTRTPASTTPPASTQMQPMPQMTAELRELFAKLESSESSLLCSSPRLLSDLIIALSNFDDYLDFKQDGERLDTKLEESFMSLQNADLTDLIKSYLSTLAKWVKATDEEDIVNRAALAQEEIGILSKRLKTISAANGKKVPTETVRAQMEAEENEERIGRQTNQINQVLTFKRNSDVSYDLRKLNLEGLSEFEWKKIMPKFSDKKNVKALKAHITRLHEDLVSEADNLLKGDLTGDQSTAIAALNTKADALCEILLKASHDRKVDPFFSQGEKP